MLRIRAFLKWLIREVRMKAEFLVALGSMFIPLGFLFLPQLQPELGRLPAHFSPMHTRRNSQASQFSSLAKEIYPFTPGQSVFRSSISTHN